MQQREKMLLLVFCVVIGGGLGVPKLWRIYQGPVSTLKDERDRKESLRQLRDDEFAENLATKRTLSQLAERSLPGDPAQAAILYQQWLTDMVEHIANLEEPRVTPEREVPGKEDAYVGIRMRITGKGTLSQLNKFLLAFYKIELEQRILQCSVTSEGSKGDPMLSLRLTVEGLSLPEADNRERTLFPRTELTADLDSDETELEVKSSEVAGEVPFRVRIGGEYLTVTAVTDQTWTVTRGIDATSAEDHDEEAIVELAPIHPERTDVTMEQFTALTELNPFAKPTEPEPYEPELDISGVQRFGKGKTLEMNLELVDFDASYGAVKFELKDPDLPDAQIKKTGENTAVIVWSPSEKQEIGKYKLPVSVIQGTSEAPAFKEEQTLEIIYNSDPILAEVESKEVLPGTKVEFTMSATDADLPRDALLIYADDLPDGAKFDEKTNVFTWEVPADVESDDYEITFGALDSLDGEDSFKLTLTVKEDLASETILSFAGAGFGRGGKDIVWLKDTRNEELIKVLTGESFDYAGVTGTLVKVETFDSVLFARDKDLYRLKVGKSLRDMVKLPPKEEPKPEEDPETEEAPEEEPKPEEEDTTKSEEAEEPATSDNPDGT